MASNQGKWIQESAPVTAPPPARDILASHLPKGVLGNLDKDLPRVFRAGFFFRSNRPACDRPRTRVPDPARDFSDACGTRPGGLVRGPSSLPVASHPNRPTATARCHRAWACLAPRPRRRPPPCWRAVARRRLPAPAPTAGAARPRYDPVIHVWDLATGPGSPHPPRPRPPCPRPSLHARRQKTRLRWLGTTPSASANPSAAARSASSTPPSAISGMELTPDGKLLIVAAADGLVRVIGFVPPTSSPPGKPQAAGIACGLGRADARRHRRGWCGCGTSTPAGRPAGARPGQGRRGRTVCLRRRQGLAVADGDGKVAVWAWKRTGNASGCRGRRPAWRSTRRQGMATGGAGLQVWDADDGRGRRRAGRRRRQVLAVTFSADGRTLVSAGDFAVRLWDCGRREVPRCRAQSRITALAYAGRRPVACTRRAWTARPASGTPSPASRTRCCAATPKGC